MVDCSRRGRPAERLFTALERPSRQVAVEHIGVIGLAFEEISAADMQAFLRKHPVTYPVAIGGTEVISPTNKEKNRAVEVWFVLP